MGSEKRGRLGYAERLEELVAISGRVMPECGQDEGLQVLSTEAQRTEGGNTVDHRARLSGRRRSQSGKVKF